MKAKKLLLLIVIGVLTFALSACLEKGEAKTDYPVKLYYASSLYVEVGIDEQNGDIMPPMETKISSTPEGIYLDVLNALRTKPDDKTYTTLVTENIIINSVKLENKIAYVDLSAEGLTGGSLEELLLVEQIVSTLNESFKEVEQVQFTVDGKIVESLMGHVDVSKPIK